jgi:hypothetical protein
MTTNLTTRSKRKAYTARAFLLIIFFAVNIKSVAQISSATINVNGAIAAPTGATSSTGSFSACSGTQLTLTPTGGNTGADGVYKWYSGSCGGTLIGTGATLNYTVVSNTAIYVRIESPVCGNSACYTINLSVSSPPTLTTTLTNLVACFGEIKPDIPLAGTPTGVTFDISGGHEIGIPDTSGVTSISSFSAYNITTEATTRTITVTPKANGCSGIPVTFVILVYPQINLTAIGDIEVCNGDTVTVPTFTNSIDTVAPLGISSYAWTNNLAGFGLAGSGSDNILSFAGTNTGNAAVVGTITVTPNYTISSVTCTGPPGDFSITVNPTPNGTITIDPSICAGTSAPLIFNATNGTAYGPWTLGVAEGGVANTPTSYPSIANGGVILSASPVATTTYYLMSVTDANGCTNP